MNIRRTTRLFRGQLDLAPFLCVVFPLAFVALFSSYLVLPRGARLTLPSAEASAVIAPGEAILVVAVDAARRIFFENQIMTLENLEQSLARRINSGGPTLLLIQADASVPYGQLAELTAVARRAGVKEAVLGTLPPTRR